MSGEPPNASGDQTTRSRYPGSRPFNDTEEDRARFFGRDAEGEQLYLRVLSVSLLVQFAASGLGKTSLLQASLLPRLRQKSFLPIMVRLNASEESLVDAVIRSFEEACKSQGLKVPELRKDGLWELLSTALVWRDGLLLTPVLVFDQFEEVFTLHGKAFRDELAEELGSLATGIPPERLCSKETGFSERFGARPDVKTVISLREDRLGALEEFSAAIPNLFRERLRLEALSEGAARAAITRPAQLDAREGEEPFWTPRFEFEPSALEHIIAYLKGRSGVIEPFALQLLCRHAEAIAHDNSERQAGPIRIARADFTGTKSFESVLKNFYRDVLEKLRESARDQAVELCEHGFLDREGRRLSLEEEQIYEKFGIDAQTLNILTKERLIKREHRLDSVFYEISHDRLAESILASRRNRLPKAELEQRQREQEQLRNEQQQRRKLQRLVRGLAAVGVVLGVVVVVAVWFYLAARSAQVEAQKQKAVAEGERVTALSAEVYAKTQKEVAEKAKTEAESQRGEAEQAKTDAESQRSKAEQAKTEAERQRGDADKQREKAEALLGFTLGEKFLGEIRDAGRTSTLEKVRNQSEGQTVEAKGKAALVRGLALRNAGDIERNKGILRESLKDFGKSLDAIGASPDTPDKEPEIARTLDRLGDALSDSAQNGEALKKYQAEVEAWNRALKTSPPDASDMAENCAGLAQAMDNVADIETLMGQEALALKELDDALQIVSSILFGARSSLELYRLRGDKIEAYPSAKALQVLSQIAGSRADILNYKEDRESTAAVAEEAKQLMPYSISARKNALLALVKRGQGENAPAGLADYRDAMREYSALQRIDPENKLSQRDLAMSQILVSNGILSCNRRKDGACVPMPPLEEAESTVLKSIATLNSLAQSDQQDSILKNLKASALESYAQVLAERGLGGSPECLQALKQSEKIYTALERDDEPTSVEFAANFFKERADNLKDLGRPDRSKEAMQRAIDRFTKLVRLYPDNDTYVDELTDALGREAAIQRRLGNKPGADALTKQKQALAEHTVPVLDKKNNEIQDDMVTHRAEGYDLLQKGQYEAAIKEFTVAEEKALEYMRRRPITSMTFDSIRDIYENIADAQGKLRNTNEQGAALSASMHAAEIAAIVDPAKEVTLYNARIDLLRFYFDNKRYDDSMLNTARQLVADVDSVVQKDWQNADHLWQLGNANFALGDILHERNGIGWEEAFQIGIVDVEAAARIEKKPAKYWKEAGVERRKLADYLDHETPSAADDARHQRQLAFADYQEAAKRDPKDEDIMAAIRELAVAAK